MPLLHIHGIETHYHLHGRGKPVVFIHPPYMGSRVFTYLSNDLSRDYRTLTYDIRGHGRTMTSDAPLTIEGIVDDLCGLLETLSLPPAYLCAYGSAAMPALRALASRPDHFLGAALLSGSSEITNPIERAKARIAMFAGYLKAKELVTLPMAWTYADNREAFHKLRSEAEAGDVQKWREYGEATLRGSETQRLGHVHQPVLLVYGGKDDAGRQDAEKLRRSLPNASVIAVPDAPRTLPAHAASETGQAIRIWLEAVGAGERKNARHAAQIADGQNDIYAIPPEASDSSAGADLRFESRPPMI